MPRDKQKTVTMSGKALESLQEKFEKEKRSQPSLKFASFIADSALMELERKNILKESFHISLVGIHEDIVTLKDVRKRERFYEVQIRNKVLRCITDDRSDCIHVGFALALPEVRKALSR